MNQWDLRSVANNSADVRNIEYAQQAAQQSDSYFGLSRTATAVRLAESPPKLDRRNWLSASWAWLKGEP